MSSEGDKNNMPDGSGPLAEALHAETILQNINGDLESPLGVPESPEDKGIIRCTLVTVLADCRYLRNRRGRWLHHFL
jgi:hypothetical protein